MRNRFSTFHLPVWVRRLEKQVFWSLIFAQIKNSSVAHQVLFITQYLLHRTKPATNYETTIEMTVLWDLDVANG